MRNAQITLTERETLLEIINLRPSWAYLLGTVVAGLEESDNNADNKLAERVNEAVSCFAKEMFVKPGS